MQEIAVRKQTWRQLLTIQAAAAISLPNLLAGQLICDKFGRTEALLAVILGNFFLLVIGCFLASLSTRFRFSTAQNATHYFGNQGKIVFPVLLIATMICWFSIQLNIMTLGLQQVLKMIGMPFSPLFLNLFTGILITSLMSFGMKTLKFLSNAILPLLLLTLLFACIFKTDAPFPSVPLSFSWLSGVSTIVGVNIAGAIDLPTFFRHARSEKDATISVILLYGLVVPLSEIMGIYLTGTPGSGSILEIFQSSHNTFWMIWVSSFIILSGWTTNNANLYSALTSSYSLNIKGSTTLRALTLGALGSAIACADPFGSIEHILDLFAIFIGGMGAVIISNYLFDKQKNDFSFSILSWSFGVSLGILSDYFHWFITGVSALDTFILAFATQYFMNTLQKYRKAIAPNNL